MDSRRGGLWQEIGRLQLEFRGRALKRIRGRRATSTDLGLELRPGAHHYRAFVGPPERYDLLSGLQFGILFALGLREHHRVADVGCGSLRAGRLLIPYLLPGRYYGLEPEPWLVRQGVRRELGISIRWVKRPRFAYRSDFDLSAFGVRFDFVLAQSILSHTYVDLAQVALRRMGEGLADDGLIVATFMEENAPSLAHLPGRGGRGWEYPECVGYRWDDVEQLLSESGLAGSRVDWPHPEQTWFLAGPLHRADDVRARAATVFASAAPATRQAPAPSD